MTTEVNQKESVVQVKYPVKFVEYVEGKVLQNGSGGRPNLISMLHKAGKDEREELLTIFEQAWIRGRSLGLIAKDYDTNRKTIYRILMDMEKLQLKDELAEFIRNVPRKKRWYIPELDVSDYASVQNYINRAKRDQLKRYAELIQRARKMWIALKFRDPQYWTADEVCQVLATLTPGSQSGMLDAIRQVAPQIAIKGSSDAVQTGRFREKLGRRKKDIFATEVNMIREALRYEPEILDKFDLHISLGAREGSSDSRSGLVGLTWESFKQDFTRVDLYETKVRAGIWWRDCPLDIFFKDLPDRMKSLWIRRGKPQTEKVFRDGYKEVTATYKAIRELLNKKYAGKIDPSLLKEFLTLRPHDADKIHVNLLWEADVPLEVVGGQYVGKGEGIGLMGRGWLDVNVIKKHYLSLTGHSERMKNLQNQVRAYSERFNRKAPEVETEVQETIQETVQGEN